jgi:hypothetical protein
LPDDAGVDLLRDAVEQQRRVPQHAFVDGNGLEDGDIHFPQEQVGEDRRVHGAFHQLFDRRFLTVRRLHVGHIVGHLLFGCAQPLQRAVIGRCMLQCDMSPAPVDRLGAALIFTLGEHFVL